MAFENVNVESLRNALYACKNSISYNNSINIINSVSSGNIWKAESSNHLRKALTTLTNERYRQLEAQINSYLSVTNLISEYKQLEADNRRMEAELPRLRGRLYHRVSYPVIYYDAEGKPYERWESEEVIDHGVEREINYTENKIRENNNRMRSLERQVSNSI